MAARAVVRSTEVCWERSAIMPYLSRLSFYSRTMPPCIYFVFGRGSLTVAVDRCLGPASWAPKR